MYCLALRRSVAALALACMLAGPAAAQAAPSSGKTDLAGRAAIAAGLKETAVFVVLETHYPDVFAEAVESVERGIDSGLSLTVIQAEIRAKYAQLVARQTPSAEPRLIRQQVRLLQDQATAVSANPADCLMVLGFLTVDRPMQLVMPPELLKREQDWAAEMLAQTAVRPFKHNSAPGTDDGSMQVFVAAYDGLSSDDSRKRITRLAGDFADVTDPADQRAVCEFAIAMFGFLAKQSDEEAARLYLGLGG